MPPGTVLQTRTLSGLQARATSTAVTIPQQFQSSVPTCAQACLARYIGQGFTCAADDAACLCSNYSSQGDTQGDTIGEIAYTCLHYYCPSASSADLGTAYNICLANPGAVTATHKTLTLPSYSPTSTPTAIPSSSLITTTTGACASGSGSAPGATYACSGQGAPSSSTATATASHGPGSLPSGSGGLTTAQAIGVTVGAFGTLAMIAGLAYFFFCIRRREGKTQKTKDQSSYDFIDQAPPRSPDSSYDHTYAHGPVSGLARLAGLGSGRRKMKWQLDRSRSQRHARESGTPTCSAGSLSSSSHYSDCSSRTVSQLLPEPPQPPPKPWQTDQRKSISKQEAAQRTIPPMYLAPDLPSQPAAAKFGVESKPPQKQRSHIADEYVKLLVSTKQPKLSLDIPRSAPAPDQVRWQHGFPLPPAPALKPPESRRRNSATSRADSKEDSASNSLLNYYASLEGVEPEYDLPTPIEDSHQAARMVPATLTAHKASEKPKIRQPSAGSGASTGTSFESVDPHEPTWEQRLSPVEESPLSMIRYPKIPRSSNQHVSRSPVYPYISKPPTRDLPKTPAYPPLKHVPSNSVQITPSLSFSSPDLRKSLSASTLGVKLRGDGSSSSATRPPDYAFDSLDSPDSYYYVPTRLQTPRPDKESPLLRSLDASATSSPAKHAANWPLTLDPKRAKQSPRIPATPPLPPPLPREQLPSTPRCDGLGLNNTIHPALRWNLDGTKAAWV